MDELTNNGSTKATKFLEQLCGKLALCLSGVSMTRVKKGGWIFKSRLKLIVYFKASHFDRVPDKLEATMLKNIMKCFLSQLDSISNEEPTIAPPSDPTTLENGKKTVKSKKLIV